MTIIIRHFRRTLCLGMIAMMFLAIPGFAKNVKKSNSRKSAYSASTGSTYTVRKGDTIYSISRKTGVPVDRIRTINELGTGEQIHPGLRLQLSGPGTPHKVKQLHGRKRSCPEIAAHSGESKLKFQWPLRQIIGYQQDGGSGIRSLGLVITGKPGSRVVSAADGIVKKIGHMRGYGTYVVIAHADRYTTVYANIDKIAVSEGASISSGSVIGRINQDDPKLHFQIDFAGKPENPIRYLPERNKG